MLPSPTSGHRCPCCGKRSTRRSRAHLWESLLGLLLYFPYRCQTCSARFWRFL